MEFDIAIFGRFGSVAFLGVEMVLSRLARQNLATLGNLKPLGVGLVGFHTHIISF